MWGLRHPTANMGARLLGSQTLSSRGLTSQSVRGPRRSGPCRSSPRREKMSDNGVAAPGQGYARTNMTVVVDVDDYPSVAHSSASNASTLIDLGVSVEWHLVLPQAAR